MNKQRLILFFDGTWMDVMNETNVYLLAKNVLSQDTSGTRQKFFYSPGVGNDILSRLPGGIAGVGLNENLLKGYEWLCQNYDDGDEIWIFGFSRGAYTARSLAGMIRKSGLLYITNPSTLKAALVNYRTKVQKPLIPTAEATQVSVVAQAAPQDRDPATLFRNRFSREVMIDFLGVWDTVGALGIPGGGWMNRGLQWHDTQLSKIVKRAFHAMAIDEHREIFSSTPWVSGTPIASRTTLGAGEASNIQQPKILNNDYGKLPDGRIVQQRWFAGSHGDVGGGCEDPSLSRIPLAWMESQAINAGLALRNPPEIPPNAVRAPIYPSFERFGSGSYRFFRNLPWVGKGPYQREVITAQDRTEVIHPCLDPSVLERWNTDPTYRPQGLGNINDHTIEPWTPIDGFSLKADA
jgi:uncharacterized protein (DUF2235 family)